MVADNLISSLNLTPTLESRILCRVPLSPASSSSSETSTEIFKAKGSFILYLPTVVLRKRHNPGFALSCRLANHFQVPVVVLCTVLDDQHLSRPPISPITMTARRLAFTMEALQSSCLEWENHGAGVAIRVHGPGCRTPHHLSLCHRALVVVSDEPFVEPFRTYVRRIVTTCQVANVPCFTVDGSTSVPPKSLLRILETVPAAESSGGMAGDLRFTGAPVKAWKWEKQTNPYRKSHVYCTYRDGALDAPALCCPLPRDFFLSKYTSSTTDRDNNCDGVSMELLTAILNILPSIWSDPDTPCPGHRPWTVQELVAIDDCKKWASTCWEGTDTSVPPCRQTHGSAQAATARWRTFLQSGLKDYAKRRNQIAEPHAVSRISCYLNLGILSIFDILHDVWQARGLKSAHLNGCNKFLDEVIKFREGSYVHVFSSPDYHSVEVLPPWARRDLESKKTTTTTTTLDIPIGTDVGYEYDRLENASTGDEVWDAMQGYLIETGELHNNARMTWGKTVVHWQAGRLPLSEVLYQLCCLNDRFALDGLSPPSYGGILWCFGWGDKPSEGQTVSTKWAHNYRSGMSGFEQAKERLFQQTIAMAVSTTAVVDATYGDGPESKKLRPSDDVKRSGTNSLGNDSKTILSFFSPVSKPSRDVEPERTVG
jgi:hypothetical protein